MLDSFGEISLFDKLFKFIDIKFKSRFAMFLLLFKDNIFLFEILLVIFILFIIELLFFVLSIFLLVFFVNVSIGDVAFFLGGLLTFKILKYKNFFFHI